jgi:hypothetical protein
MARIDDLTSRMIGTMPLPAPESGPRFSRARLWAKAVADNETQTAAAIEQMKLPATLERVDANPTVWTEESSAGWRFLSADAIPGASDVFLNLWGRALQVPRYNSETDQPYARRIVDEVISPSTTNMGMGALIDRLLGMTGTRVIEGEGFFSTIRLNDGHRLNAGKRLMGFGAFGAESLWNTFIVVLPSPLVNLSIEKDLIALIDRRRGAGNRLLAIVWNQSLAPTMHYVQLGYVQSGYVQ